MQGTPGGIYRHPAPCSSLLLGSTTPSCSLRKKTVLRVLEGGEKTVLRVLEGGEKTVKRGLRGS